MRGPLLVADGIAVRLGDALVLRDVRFEVAAGEVLGVFGPSGAGKSTLFRALAGEERLAAGRVLLDGEDASGLPLWQRARRGLGYLPQTPSVLWDLSVAENLAAFRALSPLTTSVGVGGAVDALGLGERLHVRASSLSGGERRRLELLRALSVGPRVLLCDEPFAAVDPVGAARVGAALRALAASGAAVLIADHHVAEALELCDRAALLLDGEIGAVATPEAFRRHPLVRKHYVALPPSER